MCLLAFTGALWPTKKICLGTPTKESSGQDVGQGPFSFYLQDPSMVLGRDPMAHWFERVRGTQRTVSPQVPKDFCESPMASDQELLRGNYARTGEPERLNIEHFYFIFESKHCESRLL